MCHLQILHHLKLHSLVLFPGAKVVCQSLRDTCGVATSTTDIPGTGLVVNAIYGFCDIRNFTDLTEVTLRVDDHSQLYNLYCHLHT